MSHNPLKTKEPDEPLAATKAGPRPADFPIGSVASRAAARAIVNRLADMDGPQPGVDVLLQLEETGWPERHREIIRVLEGQGRFTSKPERLPGVPLLLCALPADFNPGELAPGFRKAPGPKGSVAIVPCVLTDIPYFWPFLTDGERRRLLGGEAEPTPAEHGEEVPAS